MTSSIRTTVHESLPYIDVDPTPAERSAAESLIAAELSSSPASPVAPTTSTNFTPLMTTELERISRKEPLVGIDPSRYEIQDTPSGTTTADLEPALSRAYATHTYLGARHTHLALLDAYGKNAWLVSNWQTETELAALERDLSQAKRDIDVVNLGRRSLQDDAGDELRGLDNTWRRGVGRVLETEVATEALRLQLLEMQRRGP